MSVAFCVMFVTESIDKLLIYVSALRPTQTLPFTLSGISGLFPIVLSPYKVQLCSAPWNALTCLVPLRKKHILATLFVSNIDIMSFNFIPILNDGYTGIFLYSLIYHSVST